VVEVHLYLARVRPRVLEVEQEIDEMETRSRSRSTCGKPIPHEEFAESVKRLVNFFGIVRVPARCGL
jgi:hypothetical protein